MSVANGNTTVERKTQWGSIWVAAVVLFLIAIQFSIYLPSLWPYLSQIDKGVTQTFYGFVLAAYSGGQMIASPIFGWCNGKIKRVRWVAAVGVWFSIFGNLLYIFTEAVTDNRKWMVFGGRLLCGIAGGIAGTVRGYVATASVPKDQHRAVAIGTVAWSLGIAGGPLFQAIVTPVGYPTSYVWGPLYFNEYTATAYISILAALILLVLLHAVFKENYIGVDVRKNDDPFHYVPKPDLRAAMILWLAWFAAFFMLTNTDSVESPFTMAMFDWSQNDAAMYNSIIMGVSCLISFVIYVVFTLYGHRINERVSIVAGLSQLFAFYAITYAWPFYKEKLQYKLSGNSSTAKVEVGCDLSMEWCEYTPRLPLPVYLVGYILLSTGFPMCNVAISTLYAKVLGPRRQGFMQSMMVMSGSLARTIGPIIITWLFSEYGPRVAWTMTSCVLAIALFTLMIDYDRLVPLKMRPKLAFGQKLRYDGGKLYRF